jgi:hypothetical protein
VHALTRCSVSRADCTAEDGTLTLAPLGVHKMSRLPACNIGG